MLLAYPDYYPAFRCLADKCRHTCCAGWEIDVDPAAAEVYRGVPGALGEKLARVISAEPTPHFMLSEGERCPFLTAENLCELILHEHGGEGLLCQICRDHPRWRSFLPGRTEIGVGLCCEAAARLILTRKKPVKLVCEGAEGKEDGDAQTLLAWRDAVLAAAQDRSMPLQARMEEALDLCAAELPPLSTPEWARLYRALERLDEAWTDKLDRLEAQGDLVDITQIPSACQLPFEQVFVYFLHRHFLKACDDGDVTGKVALAVLSTRLLMTLFALDPSMGMDGLIDLARMYSAEIEYSDENLYALYDALKTP